MEPVSQWILRYIDINPAGGPLGPDYFQGSACSTTSTFFVRGDTDAFVDKAENIILDHVTISGAGDESLGLYGGTESATFQNSFAGNALYAVGMCCPEQSPGVSDCWVDDGDGTPPSNPDTQVFDKACKTNSDCSGGDACDLTFTACRGHSSLIGGNHGNPPFNEMQDTYKLTLMDSAFGESHIRSPKISGMFSTHAQTCTGSTCDGGFRLGDPCINAEQCPDNSEGGTIDVINIFNGAPGAGPSKILGMIIGSNEQFVMMNYESSIAERGGESGQGRSQIISTIGSNDYFYINDFVGTWETFADDGIICERIPNNRSDCVTNAQCQSDCDPGGSTQCECDLEPACPLSAPCDIWSSTDSNGVGFVGTVPTVVVSSRIGGATYTGVADSEIDVVADVREFVVGASRSTGDDFPFESELLEATLDELRDGLGSQYHCPWSCPSSSGFNPLAGNEGFNRCPSECTTSGSPSGVPVGTGQWVGDSGTVGWWQDDRWDGTCVSGGADCRCVGGTVLDGATCASTDCSGECQLGVVTTGSSNYASDLGGYWADTDFDGLDDAWEITNFGDITTVATTDTTCDGWNDGINDTNFNHLECIEVFMAERIGTLTAPASGFTGVPQTGVSLTGGAIGL